MEMEIREPLEISTHAPHAGRDGYFTHFVETYNNFNSRAPCGARLMPTVRERLKTRISTHAPHAGRDEEEVEKMAQDIDFNSRAPCGARL